MPIQHRFLPPGINPTSHIPGNDYMMGGTELVLPFEPSPKNLTGENELFAKISEYDKQSMPANWIGPEGSGGYASNWRHAGNTALLKNQMANAISPVLGDKISSMVGGTAAFGGGLLHELTSNAPIFEDERRMVDEVLPFDVGPSKKLSPEFKSDTLANLYGSWKGQTGIANTGVLENLLTDMSKDDAWSNAFSNLIAEEEENKDMSREMMNMHFIPNREQRPWEPRGRWVNPFANKILNQQSWINRMRNRKKSEIPTLRSDTSNITRGPGGGGGGWSPSGADLSPGGGYGQSPTGSDIAGTPFSRGGILGAF
jgi:hypothetical protein